MVASPSEEGEVYCTLLMSDSYLPGAAVLASSLRDSGTKRKIACLVTPDSLLQETVSELKTLFDYIIPVNKIANPNLENLARLDRLDLRFAFTKIALWRQTQFRKIIYIDADVVALRAPDELFDLDVPFAAAPDIGWPDCFNTGVMLLKPDMGEYWSLQTLAASGTSFDGADQGLLNEYFDGRPWHRLSFTYNCTPSSGYQYEPAYRHYRSSIKMVHFIGKQKPWQQGRQALSAAGSGTYKELLSRWWSVYDRHYQRTQSSALGQVRTKDAVVQHVLDHQAQSAMSWAAAGNMPNQSFEVQTHRQQQPVVPDEPLTGTVDRAEHTDQGLIQPAPTIEQRRFSAPQNEWDATKSEPPVVSRPEASDFPTQQYSMSHETNLFKAPASYPEPPKNMWYEVPETKPALHVPPKPIFPWEQTAQPKPTRVFVEEPIPVRSPQRLPEQPEGETKSFTPKHVSKPSSDDVPPPMREPTSDSWDSYSRLNAWDNVDSIEQYVRAFKTAQANRGKVQVLQSTVSASPKPVTSKSHSKESLVLTDFPTAVERPSLPVTPNPIRRPSFWGSEEKSEEELPQAQNVPEQEAWNPLQKLEELRRSSLLAAQGQGLPTGTNKSIPLRESFKRDTSSEEMHGFKTAESESRNTAAFQNAFTTGSYSASEIDSRNSDVFESRSNISLGSQKTFSAGVPNAKHIEFQNTNDRSQSNFAAGSRSAGNVEFRNVASAEAHDSASTESHTSTYFSQNFSMPGAFGLQTPNFSATNRESTLSPEPDIAPEQTFRK